MHNCMAIEFNRTKLLHRGDQTIWLVDVFDGFGTRSDTWIRPYDVGDEVFGWFNNKNVIIRIGF